MFSTSDTIVAIATPPGRGGIGVVRLSGPDAHRIARAVIALESCLEPRRATFARVAGIDQVIVTYFPAPRSYTGDETVEVSAHGSPVVLRAIVGAAMDRGARLAEPGEFTLRAFLNGRIDLPQAEAVGDLIDAVTPLQARAAFDQLDGTLTTAISRIDGFLFDLIARLEASIDFPEEGYHFIERPALLGALDDLTERTAALLASAGRGRLVREGLRIAIVGRPNVGKSSLFNALVGSARAIVTDVPGTTRDLVTEVVDIDGLRATLVDTAGLCDSANAIEAEGVERARQAQAIADLTLIVLDRSDPADAHADDRMAAKRRVIVANKSDLPAAWHRDDVVEASARTGSGLESLRNRIAAAMDGEPLTERPEITNSRHIALVRRAHEALLRARTAAGAGIAVGAGAATQSSDGSAGALSEEFVLADLEDARAALEEITGRRAPEAVLTHIFSRFCIGK